MNGNSVLDGNWPKLGSNDVKAGASSCKMSFALKLKGAPNEEEKGIGENASDEFEDSDFERSKEENG